MNDSISLPQQPVVIVCEDPMPHQPPYFFCSTPSCPCHSDKELTAILQAMIDAKEVTPAQALNIFWNQVQA